MELIYTVTVLIATLLGAIAGLGGGIIIKPVFDIFGYHNAISIGIYSSFAVLTMSIISIYKFLRQKVEINYSIVIYASFGGIIGGIIGEIFFKYLYVVYSSEIMKKIQSLALMLMLVLIISYAFNKEKFPTYKEKRKKIILLIGIVLGFVSVFLGIGGGPLNIFLLSIFFSFDIKESTCYSIAIIFFSQLSKIIFCIANSSIRNIDLSIVPLICISGVIGGFIGTNINRKFDNKKIEFTYLLLIIGLLILNFYNGFCS